MHSTDVLCTLQVFVNKKALPPGQSHDIAMTRRADRCRVTKAWVSVQLHGYFHFSQGFKFFFHKLSFLYRMQNGRSRDMRAHSQEP